MARDDGDLIHQLQDTLASLGMLDEGVRDAIVQEVRTALSDAPDDRLRGRVHVLDGGRGRGGGVAFGEPISDEELAAEEADEDLLGVPHLAVFDRDDVLGHDDDAPRVAVRIVRADAPRRPKNLRLGHLRLPADAHVWQTLLHGRTPATYRVHCDEGELHVAIDGELVARLEAGQSTDVEGAVLRVRACGEEPAVGRYDRIG
jgi:hypothetical protein